MRKILCINLDWSAYTPINTALMHTVRVYQGGASLNGPRGPALKEEKEWIVLTVVVIRNAVLNGLVVLMVGDGDWCGRVLDVYLWGPAVIVVVKRNGYVGSVRRVDVDIGALVGRHLDGGSGYRHSLFVVPRLVHLGLIFGRPFFHHVTAWHHESGNPSHRKNFSLWRILFSAPLLLFTLLLFVSFCSSVRGISETICRLKILYFLIFFSSSYNTVSLSTPVYSNITDYDCNITDCQPEDADDFSAMWVYVFRRDGEGKSENEWWKGGQNERVEKGKFMRNSDGNYVCTLAEQQVDFMAENF